MSRDAYAVIMAGGRGTRFWPMSRRTRAKQFLQVTSGGSLLQKTVARIEPLVPRERVFVVLGEDQRDSAVQQLPATPESNFIVEPVGRNTGPAIGLSTLALMDIDPEGVMVVLPSDHLIGDETEYRRVLAAAISVASASDALVVMGIRPGGPDTGFGYIAPGDPFWTEDGLEFRKVDRFQEKPDLETAGKYVKQGCLWNSGMFVWRVATIWSQLQTHLPALRASLDELRCIPPGPERGEALARVYPELEAVSIDYGVMEKSGESVVVPCEFGWNDVGSWSALASVWEKDEAGNAIRGKAVTLDSQGCIVSTEHRLVALLDMEDVIVIDTPDAVLVCPVSSDQRLRDLVFLLETSSLDKYL